MDRKAATAVNVGETVHYVSYGTPRGEYTSQCRAAVVTESGQWVTVKTADPESFDRSEGRPIRELEQWWFDDAMALTVLNPTGLFFNGAGSVACHHDPGMQDGRETGYQGGTWHTLEECRG